MMLYLDVHGAIITEILNNYEFSKERFQLYALKFISVAAFVALLAMWTWFFGPIKPIRWRDVESLTKSQSQQLLQLKKEMIEKQQSRDELDEKVKQTYREREMYRIGMQDAYDELDALKEERKRQVAELDALKEDRVRQRRSDRARLAYYELRTKNFPVLQEQLQQAERHINRLKNSKATMADDLARLEESMSEMTLEKAKLTLEKSRVELNLADATAKQRDSPKRFCQSKPKSGSAESKASRVSKQLRYAKRRMIPAQPYRQEAGSQPADQPQQIEQEPSSKVQEIELAQAVAALQRENDSLKKANDRQALEIESLRSGRGGEVAEIHRLKCLVTEKDEQCAQAAHQISAESFRNEQYVSTIRELEKSWTAQEALITQLRAENQSGASAMAAQKAEIMAVGEKAHQEAVERFTRQIDDLKKTVAEKDKKIAKLVEGSTRQIDDLKKSMADKDQQLEKLTEANYKASEHVRDREIVLNQRESTITALQFKSDYFDKNLQALKTQWNYESETDFAGVVQLFAALKMKLTNLGIDTVEVTTRNQESGKNPAQQQEEEEESEEE